jgi:hypothetical protein
MRYKEMLFQNNSLNEVVILIYKHLFCENTINKYVTYKSPKLNQQFTKECSFKLKIKINKDHRVSFVYEEEKNNIVIKKEKKSANVPGGIATTHDIIGVIS